MPMIAIGIRTTSNVSGAATGAGDDGAGCKLAAPELVCGLPAAGKSQIARALAARPDEA